MRRFLGAVLVSLPFMVIIGVNALAYGIAEVAFALVLIAAIVVSVLAGLYLLTAKEKK